MRKSFKKLEEIEEKKKLTTDKKQEIMKIIFDNIINAIYIMMLFVILMVIPVFIQRNVAITIFRATSIIMLAFSIVLFEIAYKKDDGQLAITGIEGLILAIILLFTPYGFIKRPNLFLQLSGTYYAVYYIIKACVLTHKEKKKYLKEVSDISEIVKKENQDNLKKEAEIAEQNRKNKKKVENVKKEVITTKKRGRGRPRKEQKVK